MSTENKEDYLKHLAMTFRDMHTCEARHIGTMPIVESFNGHVMWDGQVEIFELTGHPKTKTAYAWSLGTAEEKQTTIVLHIPPVDSPRTAVQASIVAFLRRQS